MQEREEGIIVVRGRMPWIARPRKEGKSPFFVDGYFFYKQRIMNIMSGEMCFPSMRGEGNNVRYVSYLYIWCHARWSLF